MKKSFLLAISLSLLFAIISKANGRFPEKDSASGYISVDKDIRLFYQTAGSGKEVVIIPMGFLMYNDFKYLSKNFKVIFYDMRGRGRSDEVKDTSKISIMDDVADLEKVRSHFGVEKVILIGNSYLGLMIAIYASHYPMHVHRFIQIAPIPIKFGTVYPKSYMPPPPMPRDTAKYHKVEEAFAKGEYDKDPRAVSLMIWNFFQKYNLLGDTSLVNRMGPEYEHQFDFPNEWYSNLTHHFKYHIRSIQQLNFTILDVKKISCPVLVIHGTLDRNAPYGGGREWAKEINNARLVTVNGAGHIPWLENPKLIFKSVEDFLLGRWPAEAKKL